MILSFKKCDNLLLYLSLKVGVIFMNSLVEKRDSAVCHRRSNDRRSHVPV